MNYFLFSDENMGTNCFFYQLQTCGLKLINYNLPLVHYMSTILLALLAAHPHFSYTVPSFNAESAYAVQHNLNVC